MVAAVTSPSGLPPSERAAPAEVLMGEAPVALDVDQPHAGAGAAGPLPGRAGADAAGRVVEVALAAAQVVPGGRGRQRDRRLGVGELDEGVLAQEVGQGSGSVARPPAWTTK